AEQGEGGKEAKVVGRTERGEPAGGPENAPGRDRPRRAVGVQGLEQRLEELEQGQHGFKDRRETGNGKRGDAAAPSRRGVAAIGSARPPCRAGGRPQRFGETASRHTLRRSPAAAPHLASNRPIAQSTNR